MYEAIDQRLDRTVAVKIMHAPYASDPLFVDRFIREAKSAARLSNPHVVAVYDQGKEQHLTYLVMEKVDGHTLRDLLAERGRLELPEAIGILEPMLQALSEAHKAGLVHRDVKPENVLISRTGSVKVADFGLARAVAAANSSTTRGVVMGTVAYVSPEQIMNGEVDQRSDVYAAGIVLYEMLTGDTPYTGNSAVNIAFQHVHSDVPPARDSAPDLPSVINDLLLRATRRDQTTRPPDATAFLTELQAARKQLGITPTVVSTPEPATATHSIVSKVPAQLAATSALPSGTSGKAAVRSPDRSVDDPTVMTSPLPTWHEHTSNGHAGRKLDRKKLIYLGIGALVTLAVIAAIIGWAIGSDGSYSYAPNLVGLTKTQAEKRQEAQASPSITASPRAPIPRPLALFCGKLPTLTIGSKNTALSRWFSLPARPKSRCHM